MVKKSQGNYFNYTNLAISSLAFLISAGSLYFSYFVYSQSNKEVISITALPLGGDYITHIEPALGILTTRWVIVLSNNGDKTSSIISYSIVKLDSNNKRIWYSDLDQGTDDEYGQRISMPIDIEPGKSKKIIVNVGFMFNENVGRIIKGLHFPQRNLFIESVKDSLYRHNIDLFGNAVEATFYKSKLQTVKWSKEQKQDKYYLLLITAKQATFSNELKLYPF